VEAKGFELGAIVGTDEGVALDVAVVDAVVVVCCLPDEPEDPPESLGTGEALVKATKAMTTNEKIIVMEGILRSS